MTNEKNNNITISSANLEQNISNASLAEEKAKRHDSRISIHVHSVRKRLTDPDGASAKAVIDGLVIKGLLFDDSAKFIEKVTYSQRKTKKEENEVTFVTLTTEEEIDYD